MQGNSKNTNVLSIINVSCATLDAVKQNLTTKINQMTAYTTLPIRLYTDFSDNVFGRYNTYNGLLTKISNDYFMFLGTSQVANTISIGYSTGTWSFKKYYSKEETDSLLNNKQNTLQLDTAPTNGSSKFVNSGAIYTAISNINKNQNFFVTVGSRNADFSTINEAINFCKTNSISYPCILIQSGTYNENINLLGTSYITLFGMGYVRVVNKTAVYPDAALYVTGDGSFYNIEFVSQDNATNAYGLHIEALNDPRSTQASNLNFYNCTFNSTKNHGAGIGTGSNYTLTFNNCRFVSTLTNGSGLFMHNYAATGVTGYHEVTFIDCRFTPFGSEYDISIHDAFKMNGLSGDSPLTLTFKNCSGSHNKMRYAEVTNQYVGYLPENSQITLSEESQTNGILGLDKTKRYLVLGGILSTTPAGVFSYPLTNANKYNITISQILDQNSENVTSQCAITGSTNTMFVGTCPANSGVINANFVATPI